MQTQPGYPLPSGELGSDDIVCQLVFLPDRPEYWQAFVSSLHYLATWRAWERDTDKRGKSAAADWRVANEMTMECWRMTCLQTLQDDVAAIRELLETPTDCCADSDPTGGDQYTDRVEDGVGNVPQNITTAGYTTGVGDWDGFDDYKCMIAHVLVDQIGPRLEAYLPMMDFGGKWLLGISAVAAIATIILAPAGAILAVGILATTGTIAALYWALFELGFVDDLIDNVAENYDALVCAVYNSDGDDDALASLNDKIDELFNPAEALVLTNMNLGPTLKALYAGRYDQVNIAQELSDAGYDVDDFNCDCVEPIGEHLTFTDFETGTAEGWLLGSGATIIEGDGVGGSWAGRLQMNTQQTLHVHTQDILTMVGLTSTPNDEIHLNAVQFSYKFSVSDGQLLRMSNAHDGSPELNYYGFEAAHTTIREEFDPPLVCTHTKSNIVMFKTNIPDQGAGYVYIDHIYLDFDFYVL